MKERRLIDNARNFVLILLAVLLWLGIFSGPTIGESPGWDAEFIVELYCSAGCAGEGVF